MISSNLMHDGLLRYKTLKNKTSLKITQKKNFVSLQTRGGADYVKGVRTAEIRKFLGLSKFILCLRFFETSSFKHSDLMATVDRLSVEMISVRGFSACNSLADVLGLTYSQFTELLLTSGSLFFLRAQTYESLILAVRTFIQIEENAGLGAMLSLCFVRDSGVLFDLRSDVPAAEMSRYFYKAYDSRESILLELLKLTSAVSPAFLISLGTEIALPSRYGADLVGPSFWLLKDSL